MKHRALLLGLFTLSACASQTPYATTLGTLAPGATMTISAADTDINAYAPLTNESRDRFTVAATSKANAAIPSPPAVRRAGNGIVVTAPDALERLLVRVPDKVNLTIEDARGNVSVTSITGNVDVSTRSGDVRVMVPGYAQAATGAGQLEVTIGATQWPGTLKFADGNGDVEVYIPETARFHVRLHTGDGTLFTDFGLRGSAQGKSETIDAPVNGGTTQGVDIEVTRGTIRLLRLAPQA